MAPGMPSDSPAEEKALAAEKRIAIVRAAVIAFNVGAYYWLLPDGFGIPWLAAVVSVVALTYAALVIAVRPYRWWPVMRAALFTALTDGALIVLWVAATGGVDSPFHLLWLLSMMAVAFRYESRATLLATGLYIGSYVALLAWQSTLVSHAVDVAIRCTYIGLAGLLGALLAHDSARIFEEQAQAHRRITERKREQEALELDRLRDLDQWKTEFINSAAHELNTPLTPLRLQLHLLQSSTRLEDTATRARAVTLLQRNVDRIGLLVQDMLDVARLQSGRMELRRQDTDLATLVHDALETYAEPAKAKAIHFSVEGPAQLPASLDGKRVSQILFNLVSNAIKYSPPGGRVGIRFAGDGHEVRFSVEDEGPGFTADQHSRMFVPFSQVHADGQQAPGTGLGLFISRRIAQRHGGTLDGVSAGHGKGAVFTCVLPAALPTQASSPPAP